MKKYTLPSSVNLLLILFFGLSFNIATAQTPFFYLTGATNSSSVIEGSSFTFSAHLNGVSSTNTVINITTVDSTAVSPSDYTPLITTITIPAGQLSYNTTLTIPTINDSTIESDEYFSIVGTVTSGNTSNTSITFPISITDNDTVPTLFSYDSYTVTEPNGFSVYYYLSNPYNSPITIHWTTANGTAGVGDFTAINSTTTIPPGQTSGYIGVITTDDALIEPNETFTLTGAVTSGNTTNLATVTNITIKDNDVIPTLSFGNYALSAQEGNDLTFYAYLDRAYNSNVVVQITTSNGTAGSADYTATSGTYTISAGSQYISVTIPITDDTLDEPNETFTVTGTVTSGNTTNPTINSTVNIIDNDGLPDFVIYSNSEPVGINSQIEEGQSAYFWLGLTHVSNSDTVVQITTSNGTAGSADYTTLTTTVTIPAGQSYLSSSAFTIPTILDMLQEPNETFQLNGTVTSGNTYNNSDSVTYTILDNYNANAQDDVITSVVEVGTTFDLLANDTYHGLSLNPSTVNITLGTNTVGATINSQGVISIPSSLAMGYYQLTYTICEVANPGNCDTASITLIVESPLEATYNLVYSDYNADGFTSVGDILTYHFNITNNGNAPITNIHVDNMFNINVLGGPIASLNSGQTDSTTFTAIHIITQDDINYGFYVGDNNQFLELSFAGTYYGYTVDGWAQIENPFTLNISDGIRLKAFVDTNTNGVQDGTEISFPLGHFNYEINNTGIIHNLYSTPFYLYESNPTTTYDLTYQVDSAYAANNICTASYPNITVPTGSGITTYNFPVTVTPYQDLSVNIHNYFASPRPGFMYYSYISYTNNSNQTVASGTLTFTKDPAISTVGVCDNTAVITSTGFTYNFTNLLPYETRYFWIQMAVPNLPTVSLGQLLTNTVSITLPPGDILPLNNTSSLTETIIGAYDPNEKTESHGGKILQSSFSSNDYLTYTIKFENTGTANAINVKVSDVLDDKLDETTIKMIDASHEYTLERINKTLTWNFFAIDLPPSEPDTTIGHGYIVFQIKPKAGYAIGDIIPNSADIYFDFNPAITTDDCVTEFVQSLNTNNFAFNDLEYYPNPVKNSLSISNSSLIDTIEITSMLGQRIVTKQINDLQTEINLTDISKGIYFAKVTSDGQEKVIKIVKE